MEIAFDLMTSLRAKVATAVGEAENGAVDWSGLHARLAAAHAARRALQGESRAPTATGGFALWTASNAASGHASRFVNRTGLVDGKVAAGIEDGVAGQCSAGGRG